MKKFDHYFNYEDVWLHSAATKMEKPEFTLHFAKDGKSTGDVTLMFSSIKDVEELVMNLTCAFDLSEFTTNSEDE